MRRFLLVIGMGVLISCSESSDDQAKQIHVAIETVNKSFASGDIDSAAIKKATEAIKQFADRYPSDTMTTKYLFQLGLIQQKEGDFTGALTTLDHLYQKYPNSKEAPNAVFLQGFLYANQLNDLTKAKEKYELYLQKYPNVDPKVTQDVQSELQNLGKSPDEILKEIQQKAATDTSVRQS